MAPGNKIALFCKVIASAAFSVIPAGFIALTGTCQFYLSTVPTTCNCPAQRLNLARGAFERNYQNSGLLFVVLLLCITAIVTLVPWTRYRLCSVVLSGLAGVAAWYAFPEWLYRFVDPSTENWWNLPLVTLTAGPFSEYAQVFSPVLTWPWGFALAGAIGVYILAEISGLVLRSWRQRKTKGS